MRLFGTTVRVIGIAAVLAGCQAGGVRENLDRQSGLTIVADTEPAVFARTRALVSRSARDYLYIGPVEVNERGVREYFLWVGVGSTIDDSFAGAEITVPDRLIIERDGAPMEFALMPWDQRVPRLAGRSIYQPVVAPTTRLAARVTLDQLSRLIANEFDTVRVASGETPSIEYFLWQATANWPGFARYTGLR